MLAGALLEHFSAFHQYSCARLQRRDRRGEGPQLRACNGCSHRHVWHRVDKVRLHCQGINRQCPREILYLQYVPMLWCGKFWHSHPPITEPAYTATIRNFPPATVNSNAAAAKHQRSLDVRSQYIGSKPALSTKSRGRFAESCGVVHVTGTAMLLG